MTTELQQQVGEVPFWWHSIDLGNGVVTPGVKSNDLLEQELANLGLPDLRGKTVLDIGSWDGFFAFAAERLGAERVVALDHYMWSVDMHRWLDYRKEREARGETLQPCESVPELWHPEELPGKRGFDIAHAALGSRVEVIVGDFMDVDLRALGRFDVVLYLGVLYHVRHPLLALERLAQVTGGEAFIETQAQEFRGRSRQQALCRFLEHDEFANDPSNWWIPNERALAAMCRAAGFGEVKVWHTPVPLLSRARSMLTGSAPSRAYVRASA